jgi:hypothetical protein
MRQQQQLLLLCVACVAMLGTLRGSEASILMCTRIDQPYCTNGTNLEGMDYCASVGCLISPSIYRCRGQSDSAIKTKVDQDFSDDSCRTIAARIQCETTYPVCDVSSDKLVARQLCFKSCTAALTPCMDSEAAATTYCTTQVGPAIAASYVTPPTCYEVDSFGDAYCEENGGSPAGSSTPQGSGYASTPNIVTVVAGVFSGVLLGGRRN